MILEASDWLIIIVFFSITLFIGWLASKTAGKNSSEFFLAGKNMTWWILGISMVATTFAADTPNFVTALVRENGVAKNWCWWSFLITGMVTTFIYSKLWKRSGIDTDLNFYTLRYGGKGASFLRGFRALYLGIFFNCLIMSSVILAAIKFSSIIMGISALPTVIVSSIVIIVFSTIGGLKGVIWTDFFQFIIAIFGAFYVAYIAVYQPEIGGLSQLFDHPSVQKNLNLLPSFKNPSQWVSLLFIPIAVQWWSVWYPGAEPGGGGYVVQRMLAAKNEQHALGATLFFNLLHYALRSWPWIIVALASMILFPTLESIQIKFPHIEQEYLGNDLAYPAMLSYLSPGWLGLVVASLIAAFMSTISTHLNWGASYVVKDFYLPFINPNCSEKQQIWIGRLATILLMVISGIISLTLMNHATQAFNIILLSGTGTGAIFLLRWFWWRINAWSEISSMIFATLNAFFMILVIPESVFANKYLDVFSTQLAIVTLLCTITWLTVMYLTPPEEEKVLSHFAKKINPSIGWKKYRNSAIQLDDFGKNLLCVFLGCVGIYSCLFSIGNFLYGHTLTASIFLFTFLICSLIVSRLLFSNKPTQK